MYVLPEFRPTIAFSAVSISTEDNRTVRSKFVSDYLNLVIFGNFQNNFRPKNRNFQNYLADLVPEGLVALRARFIEQF